MSDAPVPEAAPAPRRLRRTWPQRLTLGLVLIAAIACFVTAGGLAFGQWVLSDRRLVTIVAPSSGFTGSENGPQIFLPGSSDASDTSAPPTTEMALAEPEAANFLVVGADNNDCVVDGVVPTGDRDDLGERSDTIMIWRANPSADQLAVLSLPRDLYVDIAGGRKARINSAYVRDDPTKLIDTIYLNFGIAIDHYVQVDFCAFQRLVDAVGGVEIPFEAPARDYRAGLSITQTGCVNLQGAQALAYVRSRHYQYEDPPGSGNWSTDGTSDFGRIARQQDFLRRVIAKVVNEGLYSPSVASAILETNRQYLVTDAGLTVRRMLEFAGTLRTLDPGAIATYRIESSTQVTSGGEEVERPELDSDAMEAVLALFRGQVTLDAAPEQELTTTTVAGDGSGDDGTPSTTEPTDTVPEENVVGVVPDRNLICD